MRELWPLGVLLYEMSAFGTALAFVGFADGVELYISN